MKLKILLIGIFCSVILSCDNSKAVKEPEIKEVETVAVPKIKEDIKITPISHATLILEYGDHVVYIDPVGGIENFEGQKDPTLILITDIHHDHLDVKTLAALNLKDVILIAPQAVVDLLDSTIPAEVFALNNKEMRDLSGIVIEAVAMYNLREEALKFHTKGRGNGYVLTIGKQRVYISGDTEDIPEMRNLKNIDIAFVCMNLPYTMTVDNAASAVLDFAPRKVYPFHYRGPEGLSDIVKFKELVNTGNPEIEVIQLNWYPNE